MRIEIKKLKPKDGDIFITGASGGVGSITVNILTNLGYNVIALSAKDKGYLIKLGAKKVITEKNIKLIINLYQLKNGLVVLILLEVIFF